MCIARSIRLLWLWCGCFWLELSLMRRARHSATIQLTRRNEYGLPVLRPTTPVPSAEDYRVLSDDGVQQSVTTGDDGRVVWTVDGSPALRFDAPCPSYGESRAAYPELSIVHPDAPASSNCFLHTRGASTT